MSDERRIDRLPDVKRTYAASGELNGAQIRWLIGEVERDRPIAEVVHRGVRILQAGIGSSGERIKVDDLWVLVTVERSSTQGDMIGPTPPASFTCPRCGRTSHNPNDAREGYCGACHEWTGGL
jgi:hypothetical protein